MYVFAPVGHLYVYLVVHDRYAGSTGRFTVHKISVSGMKETVIIGQELPLDEALKQVELHTGI